MNRKKSNKLFDETRQSSVRGGPRNGDIEDALLKDVREAKTAQRAVEKANERKRVYLCIKKFPGITEIELRSLIGPTNGLSEWLRDGIVVRSDGKLYTT